LSVPDVWPKLPGPILSAREIEIIELWPRLTNQENCLALVIANARSIITSAIFHGKTGGQGKPGSPC